ncbi:MAG TPA: ATP-dependent DNA ligase [Acidimicrobiales bacterium]|nr:ATP-dependent DNA ligase [Acidimicrobiales bacterium]
MLLADLVSTSAAVGATRSRTAKVEALVALLRQLAPDEVAATVGFLVGQPRQGRIGVGWRTVTAVEAGPADHPSLAVLDLDAALTALAATTGPGSAAARQAILADLFGRATDGEADLIRRLLVGELRQGALAGIVTDAIARASGAPLPVVRRAAMLSGDLGTTAELALHAGVDALEAVRLTVLHPVEPMLAATAADVADALAKTGEASVEWKLDGARVQVHRQGSDVRIYTRNLNDVTHRLPGVVEVVRAMPAGQVVLDGEVLGVDADAKPRAFQDTMSAFGRDDALGAGDGLLVRFFDVLHRDGVDLIDEPLSVRHAHLDAVAGSLAVPRVLTADAAAAQAALDVALAEGHEGVMVKAVDSTYEAGRRGGSWRKVKPVRTLDLVVLAAEWGHGRRQGWLSNLWLGARHPDGGCVMVGKTFKGLTDALLAWQTEALLERETGREGIVVHVRPELVVEVALDGVQASTRYPGGVALRFARVKGYRPDKEPHEADLITAVQALRAGAS